MSRILNRADAEYHRLVMDVLANGIKKKDRTGTGTTSVFSRVIRFDMKNGFPLLTTKKLHLRSIIHELLWFLSGDTNIKYLTDNNVTIWNEWAREDGSLGPVYGKQWRDFGGVDQIQNAIDMLHNNPDSRRILVNSFNIAELDKMALPPCHYAFQLYTTEMDYEERTKYWCELHNKSYPWYTINMDTTDLDKLNVPKRKLSLMWMQRSVDVGLGLPFNIASYAILLHMFSQQTNMVPNELIGSLGDVHIYDNHIEGIKEQMKRSSTGPSPILSLNKANDIFSYKFDDINVMNYEAHPTIKMPIAV